MPRISQREIASLTGLDHRRVAQAVSGLEHEPGPKNSKLYKSEEALPLCYGDDSFDFGKERARLTHHNANMAALEEQLKRGELITFDDAVADMSECIANCKAKLLSLPHKVGSIVAGMSDPHQIVGVLDSVILEALNELYQSQYAPDSESSAAIQAAAETDG